jgi:hypothetical protein
MGIDFEPELLRTLPITDTTTPVKYVCYHSVAEKHLLRREPAEPSCLAVPYEYDSILREVCILLGWQGGTRQQVLDELKRLKKNDRC